MAKQALQFGDKKTADIKLHLIGSSGEECRVDPLLLHSQVLKKAEFFETKLSERWSSDKRPFEIEVTSCHSGENYIKFIHLMYSYYADEHFNFSSVDEALTILAISSEVMFHDCIEACMLYLNAVRWSSDQKTKIGALLSSLQLNILPDLAARLSMSQVKSECERIEMVKESLEELLSRALNGTEYRGRVEEHMLDYFGENASPAVKDACRYVLLKEFNANVEAIKSIKSKYDKENIRLDCSTLSWLVGLIQRCDGKLFETVFKLFSEDTYLRDSLNTHAVTSKHAADDIHNILINRFLKAVSDGEIITPTSVRVSFLTNWVDTMVTLISSTRFPSHHPPGSTSTPASGRSTAFGATSTAAFRSTPASTQSFLFTPPSFGASSSPSAWASSSPAFGASSSTTAFGSSSTPAFGSTTTSSKSTSGKNEDLTFSALKRGIIDVGETLPLDEQRLIYNIWKDTFKKHSILSPSTGDFNWWTEKLYDAIMIDKII